MLGWDEKSTWEERRLNVLRWPCVMFDVDVVRVNGGSCRLKDLDLKNEEASIDKQEFLDMIYDLYINEWSLNYDLSRFGLEDSEAIHWEFKVYYSDSDEPVKIQGAGVYPYNFSQLEYIFDIDTWC